ncbi:hypothetical protein GGE12_006206 [Rhizobium mongolense]|uniref:Uncharacterized protein n=1 Tax=Rhizobium mongolense TaxID=57676 RepID=A0A7W6RTL8_9HYPH|nr:hypothetical protein [Rhizobium mongolense]
MLGELAALDPEEINHDLGSFCPAADAAVYRDEIAFANN